MPPIAITLILHDGNPLGIRTAQIGNSLIRAALVPRAILRDAGNIPFLTNRGIYFLCSAQKDDGAYDVYIGKSNNVFSRVTQHLRDENKGYWNYAVCFTSNDNSLSSTHADLLEGMFYARLNEVDRTNLHNEQVPQIIDSPQHDIITTDNFAQDIEILIGALGIPLFTPISRASNKTLYHCKRQGIHASGYYTEEGFLVLKDSTAKKEWAPHVQRERAARELLVEEGVLQDEGEILKFAEDHLFSSPSQAAVFVLARSANGWTEWVDKNGKTLTDNERTED